MDEDEAMICGRTCSIRSRPARARSALPVLQEGRSRRSIDNEQRTSPRVPRVPPRSSKGNSATRNSEETWRATFSARVGSIPSRSIARAASPCRELDESIRQSILIILGTAPGERVMRPHFGCEIHELVYAPNNVNTAEPRRALLPSRRSASGSRASTRSRPRPSRRPTIRTGSTSTSSTRSAPTNTSRNLVYPFYLRRSDDA